MSHTERIYQTWMELGGESYLSLADFMRLYSAASRQAAKDVASLEDLSYDSEQQHLIMQTLAVQDEIDGLVGIVLPERVESGGQRQS